MLRAICYPHLFHQITVFGFFEVWDSTYRERHYFGLGRCARVAERVQHLSNPDIALHVKSFCIKGVPILQDDLEEQSAEVASLNNRQFWNHTITRIFDDLPHFDNMTEITLQDITFQNDFLGTLAELPILASINLIDCSVNDLSIKRLPEVPVKSLAITHSIPILVPIFGSSSELRELAIATDKMSFTLDHLRHTRLVCTVLTKLTLSCPVHSDFEFETLPEVLSQCNNVEELSLFGPAPQLDSNWPLPDSALPKLKSFEGSYHWAFLIGPKRRIQSFDLRNHLERDRGPPHMRDPLKCLRVYAGALGFTLSIRLHIETVSEDFIQVLLDRCSQVRSLNLAIRYIEGSQLSVSSPILRNLVDKRSDFEL
jgi:hypothetical protein